MITNNEGKPLTISWSGLETFNDCRRKWWYGYMDRIRTSSPATEVGNHVHDLAERYLKGEDVARDTRWWRILEPGLCYAPSPDQVVDKGWGVEDWLEMPCGPLPFVGKVDFYNKDLCVIGDWKTTGFKDFRYSKTPTALASHGQPLAYAYALFNDEPPASLSFQHINLLTKGRPDAMEVWAYEVPWSAVAANWETVKTTAVQMAAVAVNHQSADTVTPNQGACKKFGGCPHAEYCLASPKNRNLTTNLSKGEPTMGNNPGTNERLAALRATLGVSTDTPSPPPPTPPKKKTEEGDLASAVEKAGQVLNALGSVPEDVLKKIAQNAGVMAFQVMQELGLKLQDGSFVPVPKTVAPTKVHLGPGTPAREAEALVLQHGLSMDEQMKLNQVKVVGGILVPVSFEGSVTEAYRQYRPGTPEAELAETLETTEAAPSRKPAPKPAPKRAKSKAPDADNGEAAKYIIDKMVSSRVSQADKAQVGEWIKECLQMRRVRTQRLEMVAEASDGWLSFDGARMVLAEPGATEPEEQPAPSRGIELVLEEDEPAAETPEPVETPEPEPEPTDEDDTVLCPEVLVDALPLSDDYTDFSDWVHPFELEVAAENGLPYYGLVGYGQGPKQVVAKVMALLHSQGSEALPDVMVLDSFHPLAAEVLPVLQRVPEIRWIKGRR